MSSNSFDLITQELLRQRQTMEILQAENRELRQQLTDLRTGRGIFIEINGKRFALNASITSQASSVQSSSSALQEASPSVADEPTEAISTVLPVEVTERVSSSQNNKQAETTSSTFLEEVMIGEFASAMASPLPLLQDPIKQQEEHKQERSEEEQKALLRRDLMGSYLLD
jgi:hypothetical protein